jgi:hypothetical protein
MTFRILTLSFILTTALFVHADAASQQATTQGLDREPR